MQYYLNNETGERCAVDSYGNLCAPMIMGVNDENIDNHVLRLRVNAGSGLMTVWEQGQWDVSKLMKECSPVDVLDMPVAWLEQFTFFVED